MRQLCQRPGQHPSRSGPINVHRIGCPRVEIHLMIALLPPFSPNGHNPYLDITYCTSEYGQSHTHGYYDRQQINQGITQASLSSIHFRNLALQHKLPSCFHHSSARSLYPSHPIPRHHTSSSKASISPHCRYNITPSSSTAPSNATP